jgi:TetR/AcrR family transcriptional regulator, tetracycline repressor protein
LAIRFASATPTAEALALADAEGLAGLTIRRLAARLGVTPNALYRYFRQKDQLLDALAEHIFTAVALPEPDDREWFVQLRGLLVAFVDALRPHPAVAGLTQTRILLSEPGINIAERALALLRGQGSRPSRQRNWAGSSSMRWCHS